MFTPRCLPILIGSLPLESHEEAIRLILKEAPEIPLWPQLPKLPGEGMVRQFISGFPGLCDEQNRFFVDTGSEDFEEQMAGFYQEYMEVEADPERLGSSRFVLGDDTAAGFAAFLQAVQHHSPAPVTLKGQITGPVTTGIGVKDHMGRSIFYDDNLRDMLIKMLCLKSRYQVEEMKKHTGDVPPVVFIDEPGIVSFGSSAFVGITREMVSEAVSEVISTIQDAGGLAGVHICANGDWSVVLDSAADIISFDAYFYFDNFILFQNQLRTYLKRGGILAWGIVPTSDPEIVDSVDSDTLFTLWQKQLETLCGFGFSSGQLMEQTLIAPSCGTGSLPPELALKVLKLNADISVKARNLI